MAGAKRPFSRRRDYALGTFRRFFFSFFLKRLFFRVLWSTLDYESRAAATGEVFNLFGGKNAAGDYIARDFTSEFSRGGLWKKNFNRGVYIISYTNY